MLKFYRNAKSNIRKVLIFLKILTGNEFYQCERDDPSKKLKTLKNLKHIQN